LGAPPLRNYTVVSDTGGLPIAALWRSFLPGDPVVFNCHGYSLGAASTPPPHPLAPFGIMGYGIDGMDHMEVIRRILQGDRWVRTSCCRAAIFFIYDDADVPIHSGRLTAPATIFSQFSESSSTESKWGWQVPVATRTMNDELSQYPGKYKCYDKGSKHHPIAPMSGHCNCQHGLREAPGYD